MQVRFAVNPEEQLSEAYELIEAIDETPDPVRQGVFARAGVILTVTAWDAFIQDAIKKCFDIRIVDSGSWKGFVRKQFEREMNSFSNPDSKKIRDIFTKYFEYDITEDWAIIHKKKDSGQVNQQLNDLIKLRGSLAHRGKYSVEAEVTVGQLSDHVSFIEALMVRVAELLEGRFNP